MTRFGYTQPPTPFYLNIPNKINATQLLNPPPVVGSTMGKNGDATSAPATSSPTSNSIDSPTLSQTDINNNFFTTELWANQTISQQKALFYGNKANVGLNNVTRAPLSFNAVNDPLSRLQSNNQQWKVPFSGTYQVSGIMACTSSPTSGDCAIFGSLNGAQNVPGQRDTVTASAIPVRIYSFALPYNTNDLIGLLGYQAFGSVAFFNVYISIFFIAPF